MTEATACYVDVEDLDAVGVLAAAEEMVVERRAREVRELRLVLRGGPTCTASCSRGTRASTRCQGDPSWSVGVAWAPRRWWT